MEKVIINYIIKKFKIKKKIYGFDSFNGFINFSKQDDINNFSNKKYFSSKVYNEHKEYLRLKKIILKKNKCKKYFYLRKF